MSEAKLRILKMLEDNRITADEAARLLTALERVDREEKPKKGRFLKIRIYEGDQDNPKVKVTVPISVAKLAAKLGGKFQMSIPDEAKQKMKEKGVELDEETFEHIDELFDELAVNGRYDLVHVEDGDDRVQIYIE
jgi:hypothetical protein